MASSVCERPPSAHVEGRSPPRRAERISFEGSRNARTIFEPIRHEDERFIDAICSSSSSIRRRAVIRSSDALVRTERREGASRKAARSDGFDVPGVDQLFDLGGRHRSAGDRFAVPRHPEVGERVVVVLPRLGRHDGEVQELRAARVVVLQVVPLRRDVVADLVGVHDAEICHQLLVAVSTLVEPGDDLVDVPRRAERSRAASPLPSRPMLLSVRPTLSVGRGSSGGQDRAATERHVARAPRRPRTRACRRRGTAPVRGATQLGDHEPTEREFRPRPVRRVPRHRKVDIEQRPDLDGDRRRLPDRVLENPIRHELRLVGADEDAQRLHERRKSMPFSSAMPARAANCTSYPGAPFSRSVECFECWNAAHMNGRRRCRANAPS